MNAPSIPGTQNLPKALADIIDPIKSGLEILQGRKPGLPPIEPPPANATAAQLQATIVEILDRLQS